MDPLDLKAFRRVGVPAHHLGFAVAWASRPWEQHKKTNSPGIDVLLKCRASNTGSPRRLPRKAFTLLEMLTSIAALVILLGLMVDLARFVRNDSSVKLTKQLLYQCDVLLSQYMQNHGGQAPAIIPFAYAPGKLDEAVLQERALQNSREFVAALRREAGGAELFAGLPDSMSNEAILSDAWGSPIVYMGAMHREIGIAPQDRPFFFSAGADRRYLTQDDNLYSYERNGYAAGKSD
jgi:type II secretory pathway pseudopilin PulG